MILKVNPKMKERKEYFMRILENVDKNKEGLRYYYENRPVKFTDLKFVETEAAKVFDMVKF